MQSTCRQFLQALGAIGLVGALPKIEASVASVASIEIEKADSTSELLYTNLQPGDWMSGGIAKQNVVFAEDDEYHTISVTATPEQTAKTIEMQNKINRLLEEGFVGTDWKQQFNSLSITDATLDRTAETIDMRDTIKSILDNFADGDMAMWDGEKWVHFDLEAYIAKRSSVAELAHDNVEEYETNT